MTSGELLRTARRRHGVSQAQLAARAGTRQSAISRIERDLQSPTVETLARLLELLGEELVLDARSVDHGHDLALLRANLALTPHERVVNAAKRAAKIAAIRGRAE
jgi:transcriptional regulator with XRE-family HTH domain